MANKKRRRHDRAQGAAPAPLAQPGQEQKQAQREEGRRLREAAIRRARRRRFLRRTLLGGGIAALLLGFPAVYFVNQTRESGAASQTAAQAGCSPVVTEPDFGKVHLQRGESVTYQRHPATSGSHDPTLSPNVHVYDGPVHERNAVHNLEHGYVVVYYRKGGDQSLPDQVIRALEGIAQQESKVIVAPYDELEPGRALALASWRRLQQCPSTITVDQAFKVSRAFISRYRGSSIAPEPQAP